MKVFAISDLHLSFSSDKPMDVFGDGWVDHWSIIKKDWDSKVGDEDVVLIAGDISWGMNIAEAAADFTEIGKMRGRKVIIKGNHDYWWSSYKKVCEAVKDKGVYPLQNNAVRFDGLVVCGSRGWTQPSESSSDEDRAIYRRELIRLELSLSEAAKLKKTGDKLIGMTHYPPFNARFEDSEVTELFEKYGADLVVYGHLHGKNVRVLPVVNKGNIPYYITSCDQINNTLTELADIRYNI